MDIDEYGLYFEFSKGENSPNFSFVCNKIGKGITKTTVLYILILWNGKTIGRCPIKICPSISSMHLKMSKKWFDGLDEKPRKALLMALPSLADHGSIMVARHTMEK